MVTELKTLKDLIHNRTILGRGSPIELQEINIDELRQEAIKWIEEDLEMRKEMNKYGTLYKYSYARVEFIMLFFNITKEELKERRKR